MTDKKYQMLGIIGRFKPFHNGGFSLLESACKNSKHVIIGIGSSNKHNIRNPFTAKETKEMIKLALKEFSNYDFVYIPDFAQIHDFEDGYKWKEYVLEKFGKLDCLISGNGFVREQLKDDYKLLYPYEIIPEEKRFNIRATDVRIEIARFGDWKKLVPSAVSLYLENNGLIERFRNEFGLRTLANVSNYNNTMADAFIEQYNIRMKMEKSKELYHQII
jgi:nicotinamide-nucleotide adenylyltransferase